MIAKQKTASERLQKVSAEYQEIRQELQANHDELQRLRMQRTATLNTSEEVRQKWRELFKTGRGKRTAKVVELQGQEQSLRAELGPLDELINELEPQVGLLQERTAGARKAYLASLRRAHIEAADMDLERAADQIFQTDEGQALLEAAARRETAVRREVLEDSAFMAGLGFDAHESSKPGFMAVITGEDRQGIEREVDRRRLKLFAGLVEKRLSLRENREKDEFRPLPTLSCEKGGGSPSPAAAMKRAHMVNAR